MMELLRVILYVLIMATSIPAGMLLSWLCDDELVKDRKYFFMMMWLLIVISAFLLIFYFRASIIFSLMYLVFVILIMARKAKN